VEQNHIRITHEAATDEPASPVNPVPSKVEAPDPHADFDFASEAEANAYWAGVADGIRSHGGIPAPRLAARARDDYPELVATQAELTGRAPNDPLDFDPVSTRHRIDGWTPQKQREYVEALADSGVARYAAARVGMSEQSASRLRRRSDARSFDLACEAAVRIGARRIRSIAYERAIEGSIKRHYYHGELKSEERVFDNRLLVYLLGKLDKLIEPPAEAETVARNWQPWMEAIEQGRPPPVIEEPADAPPAQSHPCASEARSHAEPQNGFGNCEVWEEAEGEWLTNFPPPAGFDGYEEGEPGDEDYERALTAAELRAVGADAEGLAEARAEQVAAETAARDRYFGFAGGSREAEVFRSREAEPYETCEPSARAARE
jgi:hypothetical protein